MVEGNSIGGGEFCSAVAPNTPGDQDYDNYVQNEADNAQQMKIIASMSALHAAYNFMGKDTIVSMGIDGSIMLGSDEYTLSFGTATDTSTMMQELTVTLGHYHGMGAGWGVSPYFGLGNSTLDAFNGAPSGYNFSLPLGGVSYDFNSGCNGVTFSGLGPSRGGGSYMGMYGGPPSVRGGSYT